MTADLLHLLQWWAILSLLGIIFLPFTITIFSSFFDKGYAFSKILGLLALSYISWLLSSLKIAPFGSLEIFILWLIFAIISAIFYYRKKITSTIKDHLKIFILEEFLFFLGLLFWGYIKAHEPSVHGLEKYMDFGFINSILRSDFFPPKDLWMTPLSINYYYFGHLTAAVMTKISGIDPGITYNLTLAAIFGMTLSASFSIGANLYFLFVPVKAFSRKLLAVSGALSAFLVTLGGNLHTIYAFFANYPAENPVPFWGLQPVANFLGYWYPNATRFIPFTIHEFPIYSFVVSDLHGHVFSIPFVLLFVALLIHFFHSPPQLYAKHYTLYALYSILIAVFLMTNILDGPIYLLGIFLILFAKQKNLAVVSKQFAVVIFGAILFSLPFWISFKPFGAGIGVLCAPQFLIDQGKIGPVLFEADHCARSPLWMLALLWGFFYAAILVFSFKYLKSLRQLKLLIAENPLIFILILFATILLIIPEFFYVKDIYPAHYRANTVFKFSYQAFIILGLVSGYLLTRVFFPIQKTIRYTLYAILLLPLFLLVSIYPYFAVNSYFNGLKDYKGLNGLTYLNDLYPTDYQAILWARNNIPGQPVILEAQGDSYTDFARVSSNTGLPTVIGWPVHEWLWRGSYDEAGKRSGEVTQMYESADLELTKNLLKKYNVEYVFVGALERQKYLKLDEIKFESLGKVIFQSGQTKIYKLN